VHARTGYEWINHSLAATACRRRRTTSASPSAPAPGSPCTQPYDASVFNISAMSFGALSANAILALNAGRQARRLRARHRRGLDQPAPPRVHGGDLIWEIGSGYFGCRNDDGSFSESASPPTRATRR
jgi:glutamate synthase domain-containing protein 2